jgi:phosphatidylserine/phosphatidylglycerophosphate/cardiolipin synthase-like enzyme
MQERHNVRVRIPPQADNDPLITVQGPDAGVAAWRADAEQKTGFRLATSPIITVGFAVDQGSYGAIIGPKGSVLKDLEREFNCDIEVPREKTKTALVTAVGAEADLERLQKKIEGLTKSSARMVKDSAGLAAGGAKLQAAPFQPLKLDYDARTPISDVIFFPVDPNDPESFSYDKFINYIKSATRTLEVAVFTITDDRTFNALEGLHLKGVKVRFMTEKTTMHEPGSDVVALAKCGIATRHDTSEFLMHHKYAIVDGKFVISGSFNWSRAAATGNQENVICTNIPVVVQPYVKHFETLWARGADVRA